LREHKQLPLDFVAHIVESVTNAVHVAHSKQILHRDIKPENIMLTPTGDGFDRVRLIDFGIARVENSQLAAATEIPRGIGTILYIAPEQLAGNMEQTPAVDIYSFAIVIYEMLTGKLPFQPQTMVEMFLLQEQGVKIPPSQLRPDLPPEAEKILLSALAFAPEKRPASARQFGRELAATLRGNSEDKTRTLAETVPFNLKSAEISPVAPTESLFDSIETDFHKQISVNSPRKKSSKVWIWALLGLLVLAAISITAGLVIWKGREEISNTNTTEIPIVETAPLREITYFLNVQKMRGDKPFEEPFKSSGQEIFESGYKFKLNFKGDADGFFYVFNEDKDANGKTIYNILYPTPKTNNGSAEVKAKQTIETSNNTFSGTRGTEIVWLIWTKAKNDDLETMRQAAFDAGGTMKDEKSSRQLTDFLQTYKNEKNETIKDTANQQTVVKSKGETIVQKIELEHR
jgi:serine/threonine protein kinase